jgi:hypothetical protein
MAGLLPVALRLELFSSTLTATAPHYGYVRRDGRPSVHDGGLISGAVTALAAAKARQSCPTRSTRISPLTRHLGGVLRASARDMVAVCGLTRGNGAKYTMGAMRGFAAMFYRFKRLPGPATVR